LELLKKARLAKSVVGDYRPEHLFSLQQVLQPLAILDVGFAPRHPFDTPGLCLIDRPQG
jgi:hypothetical protein